MPKHMYLLILLTLAVGFATGFLLFLKTSTDERSENRNEPTKEETVKGIEVLGYRYGGCERLGCSSYRIMNDGTYMFITRTSGTDERYDDTISLKQLYELEDVLYETDIEEVLSSQYTGMCPADYDGIAYRYEIRIDDERYSIDSCREDIENVPLFKLLSDYFEIFSVIHRNDSR